MAAKGGISQPPLLSETSDYEQWKKAIAMWEVCCKYDEAQRGPALALSLQGKAKDAVMELELAELQEKGGVEKILKTLDGLFLKDENQRMYVAMKTFEQYTRPKGTSLDNYINEFEKNHNRLKLHKIVFPDQFLAYRLLENANLEQSKNELIRTTISTLSFKEMKTQLRKLEDIIVNASSSVNTGAVIKSEPDDVYFSRSNNNGYRGGRGTGRGRGGFRGGRGGRGSFNGTRRQGNCFNCGSSDHWARECPSPRNNDNNDNDNNNDNNSNNNYNTNYNNNSANYVQRSRTDSNDERKNGGGKTEEIRLTL